jgi:hypothetical protein
MGKVGFTWFVTTDAMTRSEEVVEYGTIRYNKRRTLGYQASVRTNWQAMDSQQPGVGRPGRVLYYAVNDGS